MADKIDELQIEINSSASKANDAIDSLARSLSGLMRSLSKMNPTQATKGISSVSDVIKKQAADLKSVYGITDKGASAKIKNHLQNLADAVREGKKSLNKEYDDLFETIRKNSRFENKEFGASDKALKDWVKNHQITIPKNDFKKAFGNDAADLHDVLKAKYTTGNKWTDMQSYIAEMNAAIGTNLDPKTNEDAYIQLAQAIRSCKDETISFTEAERTHQVSEDFLWDSVLKAMSAVGNFVIQEQKLADSSQELAGTETIFQNLANGIRTIGESIGEINPENLANLATVLGSLDSEGGIKNVADGIRQIQEAATGTKEPVEELKEGLGSIDDETENAASGFEAQAERVKQEAESEKSKIQELIDKYNELKATMNGISSGKIRVSDEEYRQVANGLTDAKEELEAYKKSLSGLPLEQKIIQEALGETEKETDNATKAADGFWSAIGGAASISGSFAALSSSIEQITGAFGNAGDAMERILRVIYKPLGNVVKEYKEKFSNALGIVKNFGEGVKSTIEKLPEFMNKVWQRFTFTILRKAINAVIGDLNSAVESLRNFTGTVGQEFNASLTSIQSNLKMLGGNIVAAFAPLINAVAPIIDFIVSKLIAAIQVINQFFAALTGRSSYAVPKMTKGLGGYAGAAGKAAKAQEKLNASVLAFDELNKLNGDNDNAGGGGGGGGGGAGGLEWEELPVNDKIKEWADKIKDILSKLFEPLKEAWDRAGKYVISGFKYMASEIGKLALAIGKDFLEMWQEKATVRMFANILRIIGDIEYTIGHLAKRFREAWEYNKTGLKILERIRDIFATLIEHVRNVSKYMRDWAASINFKPLLTTFSELLKSLNKVADFLGGVFEDIMENVVLKYIKWMIEDGLPHLNEVIKSVIDAFDFEKIRSDFNIIWEAVERLAENLHTGLAEAIGEVGRAFAEWTNSAEFTEFMQSLADIMDLITAERVKKFFSALGYGIMEIVKSLANFVKSEGFQNFIQSLVKWFDSKSAQQIGKYLANIAKAIMTFKFTAFVASKLSGFFKFISTISMTANLSKAAHALNGTKTAIGNLGDALKGFGKGLWNTVTSTKDFFVSWKNGNGILASAKTGLQSLSDGYKNISQNMSGMSKAMLTIGGGAAEIASITDAMNGLKDGTKGVGAAIGEIAIGVGTAANAFSSVFGLKGGLIVTGITGLITMLANLKKQFEEANAEALGRSIVEALDNGGQSVKDFGQTFEEQFNRVTEASGRATEKMKEIEDAKTSIEDTAYSFDMITSAVKDGSATLEQKLPEIVDLFKEMKDDIQTVMDEEYYIIVSNIAGAWKDVLEASGQSAPELVRILASAKSEADGKLYEMTQSLDRLQEAYDNASNEFEKARISAAIQDLTDHMQRLAGDSSAEQTAEVIDEVAGAVRDFGIALDISEYIDGYSLSVDRFKSDTQGVSTAAKGAVDSIEAMSKGSKDALTDLEGYFNDLGVDMGNFDWSSLVGADETTTNEVIHQLGNAYQNYADIIQRQLFDNIPDIMTSAAEEWGKLNPLTRGSQAEFVHKAVEEYKNGTIIPVCNQITKDFQVAFDDTEEELNIYATGKADEFIKSAFTVTEEPDYDAFLNPMANAVKLTLDELNGEFDASVTKTKVTLNDGYMDMFNQVAQTAGEGGTIIKASLDNVVDTINSTWDRVDETALNSSVSFDALKNAVAEVSTQMQLSADDVEILNTAFTNSDGTSKTATDAYEALKSKLEEVGVDGKEFASLLNDVIPGAVISSVEATNTLKSSVDESIKSVGDSVTSFQDLYDGLYQLRDQGIVTSDQFNELKEVLVKQHDSGVSASDTYDTILEHIKLMADGGVEAVDKMGQDVPQKFEDLMKVVTDFGEGFDEGFAEPIRDNTDVVTDAVADMTQKAEDAVHDGNLKYNTPSHTMRDKYGAGFVEGFNEGIKDKQDTTKPVIEAWLNTILDTMTQFSDTLGTSFDSTNNVVQTFTESFTTSLEGVNTSLESSTTVIQMFVTGFQASLTQVETALQVSTVTIQTFATSVTNSFSMIDVGVQGKLTTMSNAVSNSFNTMRQAIQTSVNATHVTVKNTYDQMKISVSTVLTNIQTVVTQKFTAMQNTFKSKLNQMKNTLINDFNNMKSKASSTMAAMVSDVSSKLNQMEGKFKALNLTNTGNMVMQGFWNGMKQVFPSILAWAQDAANQIAQTFASAMQMGSPSKLFKKFGVWTLEGYMEGVKNKLPDSLELIEDWGEDISRAYTANALGVGSRVNIDSSSSEFAGVIINGVYEAVAAAMESYSPEVTVYSELRTDDEALARSVTRGQKSLNRRYRTV